jgi:hypothetical protein
MECVNGTVWSGREYLCVCARVRAWVWVGVWVGDVACMHELPQRIREADFLKINTNVRVEVLIQSRFRMFA